MSAAGELWVRGVGIWGAGLETWPAARAILRGECALPAQAAPIPACGRLPPAERRRASKVVNLAMTTALEAVTAAGLDAATLASIFTTSSADGENCTAICIALASPDPNDHFISPTRFHNSVQNAAAGYWAIAMGAMAPSTSLSAFDGGFGAALLEAQAALATGAPHILISAYDLPYPEPLHRVRPIGPGLGIALALSAAPAPGALARIRVRLGEAAAERMARSELEVIRAHAPAGRALPLLERLASQVAGTVRLEYLDDLGLEIDVAPA